MTKEGENPSARWTPETWETRTLKTPGGPDLVIPIRELSQADKEKITQAMEDAGKKMARRMDPGPVGLITNEDVSSSKEIANTLSHIEDPSPKIEIVGEESILMLGANLAGRVDVAKGQTSNPNSKRKLDEFKKKILDSIASVVSSPVDINRRNFLKKLAIAGTLVLTACSPSVIGPVIPVDGGDGGGKPVEVTPTPTETIVSTSTSQPTPTETMTATPETEQVINPETMYCLKEDCLEGHAQITEEAGKEGYNIFLQNFIVDNPKNEEYLKNLGITDLDSLIKYLQENDYTLPAGVTLFIKPGRFPPIVSPEIIDQPIKLKNIRLRILTVKETNDEIAVGKIKMSRFVSVGDNYMMAYNVDVQEDGSVIITLASTLDGPKSLKLGNLTPDEKGIDSANKRLWFFLWSLQVWMNGVGATEPQNIDLNEEYLNHMGDLPEREELITSR